MMKEMFFAIIKDITKFFVNYAPMGSLLASIVTLCYIGYEKLKQNKKENKIQKHQTEGKAIYIFLLILYVYIVIGITIFSRSESDTRYFSLELFRTFQNTFFSKKQICENIIMFIPYAILLFQLTERFQSAAMMCVIGIGSSLLVEVTQWLTKTGYFELDDILTNTVGMMIGYGISMFYRKKMIMMF